MLHDESTFDLLNARPVMGARAESGPRLYDVSSFSPPLRSQIEKWIESATAIKPATFCFNTSDRLFNLLWCLLARLRTNPWDFLTHGVFLHGTLSLMPYSKLSRSGPSTSTLILISSLTLNLESSSLPSNLSCNRLLNYGEFCCYKPR
jgi:hypothetical protein